MIDDGFAVITDIAAINEYNTRLQKLFSRKYKYLEQRQIGSPARAFPGNIKFLASKGESVPGWMCKTDRNKHTNILVLGSPGTKGLVSIEVQLNFPARVYNRSLAGVFLRENTGAIWVAHRGTLTRGRGKLSKSDVLREFSEDLVSAQDNEGVASFILIAELKATNLEDKLREFGRTARQVAWRLGEVRPSKSPNKRAERPQAQRDRGNALKVTADQLRLRTYYDEFSGETEMKSREGGVRVVNHGLVVKALSETLLGKGLIEKSQAIDLTLIKPDAIDLFEVKTSSNTTNIYTGVGQLAIHSEAVAQLLQRHVRKILVLPFLPSKHYQACIKKALAIHVVTYKGEGGTYVFSGL